MNIFTWIKNLFSKKPEENNWRDGLILSPVDFRDVPFGAVSKLTTPTPEEYRIPYVLTIKNQGSTPHCVGFSCATIKEAMERRENNFIEFDGDWVYNECKKIDNYDGPGTYFRIGIKILQDIGAKPLDLNLGINIANYRIGGYAQAECTFEGLKRAIYEFGAILAGFRGSNAGWASAYVRPPKIGENQWGHAVVLVGFNKDYLIGQNSWGNWGDGGYFYIPKDYLPWEAWCVLVDRPNIPEIIKPKYNFQNDLFVGLKNDEVEILQDCLLYLGCMDPAQISTGYFGTITMNAVKVFQNRYGIDPIGRVGPMTRYKLNEIFN